MIFLIHPYIMQSKVSSYSHCRNRCIEQSSYSTRLHGQIWSHSHFDRPVACCRFEDIAAIAGNRHIERGSYSTHVHRQMQISLFFKDPDILKNILPSLTSPAIIDRVHAYPPRSGTGNLNSMEIQFAVPEKFVQESKWV